MMPEPVRPGSGTSDTGHAIQLLEGPHPAKAQHAKQQGGQGSAIQGRKLSVLPGQPKGEHRQRMDQELVG